MARESAIIVPVHGIDSIIGPLRSRFDPGAALGIPAHITLLYPFHPPPVAPKEIETLARLFAAVETFDFSFAEMRRFTKTAYLHPDKADRFVRLIRMLMDQWPECRPYHGAFPDLIPHLTVAHEVGVNVLDEVADLLAGALPLACMACQACLLSSDETGYWSKQASFPFAKTSSARTRSAD